MEGRPGRVLGKLYRVEGLKFARLGKVLHARVFAGWETKKFAKAGKLKNP